MANRLQNNVYILDSATTAANPILTLTGVGSSAWLTQCKIHTVTFWSTSGGDLELVWASNTNNSAIRLSNYENLSKTVDIHFGEPHRFDELRLKTLVNGTGYLYFQ